ncbi:MAG: hypothetical protein ACXVJ7_10610 [Acidimicrobiia bacterium]
MTAPIVVTLALIVVLGATGLLMLSSRLRSEIHLLLRSFDRAERTLVPLVVTVRTDRDRLAERLARLTDAGSETDPTRR